MRRRGIEPRPIAWKATILTTTRLLVLHELGVERRCMYLDQRRRLKCVLNSEQNPDST